MALKTLNPYLFVDDAPAAIAWYCSHLGAGETLRVSSSDGSIVVHTRLRIGDCVLMLSDVTHDWSEAPAPDRPSSANLMLYVEDLDETQARSTGFRTTDHSRVIARVGKGSRKRGCAAQLIFSTTLDTAFG